MSNRTTIFPVFISSFKIVVLIGLLLGSFAVVARVTTAIATIRPITDPWREICISPEGAERAIPQRDGGLYEFFQ